MSLYGFSIVETVAQRPTTPAERSLAFTVAALAVMAAVGMTFFRANDFGAVASFLPGIGSARVVTMLATAAILRFRYRASGDASLAYLGVAYAFAAGAVVPYVMAFPGPFGREGLFRAGSQLASYLWLFWHAGFIALLAGYAIGERRRSRAVLTARNGRTLVRRYVGVTALVSVLVLLALALSRDVLPPMTVGRAYTQLWYGAVRALLLVPCAAIAVELAIRTRLRRSTDLWLAVVVTLTFVEIYIVGALPLAPSSAAFYVGHLVGVVGGSIFLAVQMRLVFELLRAFASHNRTLAEIALHDSLTGLLNRAAFEARFESLWNQCRRVREPISLLVLDLDFFKQYNDHYGHVAGDEALRRIGRELGSASLRPTDLTCRVGGEEFAMILPFTDEHGARIVAERIVLRVRALRIPHAPELPLASLTISIGAATSYGPTTHEALFELADAALYHAKRSGRDRVGSVRGRQAVRAV